MKRKGKQHDSTFVGDANRKPAESIRPRIPLWDKNLLTHSPYPITVLTKTVHTPNIMIRMCHATQDRQKNKVLNEWAYQPLVIINTLGTTGSWVGLPRSPPSSFTTTSAIYSAPSSIAAASQPPQQSTPLHRQLASSLYNPAQHFKKEHTVKISEIGDLILPENVLVPLLQLSKLFSNLCSNELRDEVLENLGNQILEILC
jgi:hypothetical protein